MARLGCKCGEGMYRSDDPSPYIVYIYYKKEVDNAIKDNPEITLNDFLTGWDEQHDCNKNYMDRPEPVDYWFCPACKRVYEVQYIPGGRWLRIYHPLDIAAPERFESWKQIYFLTDTEVYDATEENWEIRLSDYLRQHDAVFYYLSPDEKLVYAVNKESSKVAFAYELEEAWSPSPDSNAGGGKKK